MKQHKAVFERATTLVARAVSLILVSGFLLSLSGAGCALYRNDKCYVEDIDYALAKGIFVESGSLDVVARQMDFLEWKRCEKNEVLYRLQKEFQVAAE